MQILALVFRDGKLFTDYKGQRSSEALVEFLKRFVCDTFYDKVCCVKYSVASLCGKV